MRSLLATLILLPVVIQAQMPPPPLPIPPLEPVPVPVDNPLTEAKINLGKVLFWDEQMSSTNSVACGTCHGIAAGGEDPRSSASNALSIHPGADGIFNTADDVVGSPGVPESVADGRYNWNSIYGYLDQVTGRQSPPAVNAGYAPELFWDGRAGDQFSDPVSGEVLVSSGAALENQAVGPPLSDVEMAHGGQDWPGLLSKLATVSPLALSPTIPADLAAWIDNRPYASLFDEAFGSNEITAGRIGMAIASYERTLVSDQTPFNDAALGMMNLTAEERRGRGVFAASDCGACHGGALLTDHEFKYIGVVPQNEDEGRFAVTGQPQDRGQFKTPSLLNVALRAPYMHNGSLATLTEVIDFYDRGGDFDAPNKDQNIRPLNLSAQEKADLLAFLTRPLTDERVASETGPFEVPELYTESSRVPLIHDDGSSGSGNFVPEVIAIEPPLLGNPSFTVNVFNALGAAPAKLIIDLTDPGTGPSIPLPDDVLIHISTTLLGSGAGNGHTSESIALPNDPALIDVPLFARWYITDPSGAGGLAISPLIEFAMFGSATAGSDSLFEDGFE